MASTFSTDLKLELMATGENAGQWGNKTNSNLNLVQQAIAGFDSIALADGGTVTLAMTDAQLSNARNMILKFTGTLTTASEVTIPDGIEKFYIIDLSAVVGVTNLTIKTVSGTGFTAGEAKIVAAYSDGTNLNEIALDTLGGTIATSQLTGTIATAQIADNSITTAKISDNQITTAKISANQITTALISDNQITSAKIANDAVGPDQLSDTAVTAGSYTAASITVDAQGRITAAASGSGGARGFVPTRMSAGPTSGTHTFTPTTTSVLAHGSGGGGGGGTAPTNGGTGGAGGFGSVIAPKVGATTPFTIGAGGAGAPGSPTTQAGSAGSPTTFTSYFTATGGGGGPAPGGTGSAGSFQVSPGATPISNLNRSSFYGQTVTLGTGGSGGRSSAEGTSGAGSGGVGLLNVFESDA